MVSWVFSVDNIMVHRWKLIIFDSKIHREEKNNLEHVENHATLLRASSLGVITDIWSSVILRCIVRGLDIDLVAEVIDCIVSDLVPAKRILCSGRLGSVPI